MQTWKLAVIMFVISSVVFSGAGVLTVLSVPSLADAGLKLIPIVALAGFVVAAIVSVAVAKKLNTA